MPLECSPQTPKAEPLPDYYSIAEMVFGLIDADNPILAVYDNKSGDPLTEQEIVQEARARVRLLAGDDAEQCIGEMLPDANREERHLLRLSIGVTAAGATILVVTDNVPDWQRDANRPQSPLIDTQEDGANSAAYGSLSKKDRNALIDDLEAFGRGGQLLDYLGNGRHITPAVDATGPYGKHTWTIVNNSNAFRLAA